MKNPEENDSLFVRDTLMTIGDLKRGDQENKAKIEYLQKKIDSFHHWLIVLTIVVILMAAINAKWLLPILLSMIP